MISQSVVEFNYRPTPGANQVKEHTMMEATAADVVARFSDTATYEVAYSFAEASSILRKVKVLRAFMAAQHPQVLAGIIVLAAAAKDINSRHMTIGGVAFDFTQSS